MFLWLTFVCLISVVITTQEAPVKQPKFKVGTGVAERRDLYSPDPNYTKEALARGVKGTVVLAVLIDEKGCVRNPKVTRSLGYGLDEEALKVVRYWKFKPVFKSGRPVSVKMGLEFNFDPTRLPGFPVKATDKTCGETSN